MKTIWMYQAPFKLFRVLYRWLLGICLFWPVAVFSAAPNHSDSATIEFNVPHFPPYIYFEDNQVKGELLADISHIFRLAEIPYRIKVGSTYSRSVYLLEKQLSDGFFPATQNQQRDSLAQFSQPITHNNWVWFIPKQHKLQPDQPRFKQQALVGTYFQTNTHRWLIDQEYRVAGLPQTLSGLLEMLDSGRINCVFLSERVFRHMLKQQGRSIDEFNIYLESSRPFGIYLSNHYLQQYPDAMQRINRAIQQLELAAFP